MAVAGVALRCGDEPTDDLAGAALAPYAIAIAVEVRCETGVASADGPTEVVPDRCTVRVARATWSRRRCRGGSGSGSPCLRRGRGGCWSRGGCWLRSHLGECGRSRDDTGKGIRTEALLNCPEATTRDESGDREDTDYQRGDFPIGKVA